ncbi:MAG: hypothetical protein LBT74_03770 [Acidobacteriota bacterium]|jgi:probable HAF family extracellular repeat protein|nr:hypothetical protein [Acidobacteriota bacterium]
MGEGKAPSLLLVVVLSVFAPLCAAAAARAQSAAGVPEGWEYLCRPGAGVKTVVAFGNGVETGPWDAVLYAMMLKDRVEARLGELERAGGLAAGATAASVSGEVEFCAAYAGTEGAVAGRWASSDPALTREDFLGDADLASDIGRHAAKYGEWLDEGRKVVVVAHSTGNFVANAAWAGLAAARGGAEGLHILAVGTPDDRVEGASGAGHVTLHGDRATLTPGSLAPNYEIDAPVRCKADTAPGEACHDFPDAYLRGDLTGAAIVEAIVGRILAGAAGGTDAEPPDATPPSVPGGLTASAASPVAAELAWGAATDYVGVAGYVVRRDGAEVADVTATSYGDAGLAPSTRYCYTVSAYDAAGNESAQSAPVCVQTPPPTVAVTLGWQERRQFDIGDVTVAGHPASSATPIWKVVGDCGEIDENGVFTAKKIGVCAVRALTEDGNGGTEASGMTIVTVTREISYPDAVNTYVHGVNDSGRIAGYYEDATGSHGFVSGGAGTGYEAISYPDAVGTYVHGVNNDGQIVGAYEDATGTHGFLYDIGGDSYTTVDYPGGAVTSTVAYGVNDNGQIVGAYEDAAGTHGFLYDIGGDSYTAVDYPYGTVTSTVAYGVNDNGVIVGAYEDETGTHGFLHYIWWGGFNATDYPDAAYTEVHGINNNEQMVGVYSIAREAELRGFVLNAPEAGSMITVAPSTVTIAQGGTVRFGIPSGVPFTWAVEGACGMIDGDGVFTATAAGWCAVKATVTDAEGDPVVGAVGTAMVAVGAFGDFALPLDRPYSIHGVTDSGMFHGRYWDDSWHQHGFVSDGEGYVTVDPPGAAGFWIGGVTASGVIYGQYEDGADHEYAFVYDGEGYVTVAPPGATRSWIEGITDSGVFYGGYYDGFGNRHGFVSDGEGYVVVAPSGATESRIEWVTESGVVYGRYDDGAGNLYAFVSDGGGYVTVNLPDDIANIWAPLWEEGPWVTESGVFYGRYVSSSFAWNWNWYAFVYDGEGYVAVAPPGAAGSHIEGVTASGVFYGRYEDGSDHEYAFVCDGEGYVPVAPPGAAGSHIEGVAESGVFYGRYEDGSGHEYAFVYDGAEYVTVTPPGATRSWIEGVAESGVFFYGRYVDGADHEYAFVYDGEGYVTDAPPGAAESWIYGVTDSGVFYGRYVDGAGNLYAFVYDGEGYVTVDLPYEAWLREGPWVTASGVVYGRDISSTTLLINWYAFMYDGERYVPVAPDGATRSWIEWVAESGVVYGRYEDGSGHEYAFVYDGEGYVTVAAPDGATQYWIERVADSGAIYGGYFDDEGSHHAFVSYNGGYVTIGPPDSSIDILSFNDGVIFGVYTMNGVGTYFSLNLE